MSTLRRIFSLKLDFFGSKSLLLSVTLRLMNPIVTAVSEITTLKKPMLFLSSVVLALAFLFLARVPETPGSL